MLDHQRSQDWSLFVLFYRCETPAVLVVSGCHTKHNQQLLIKVVNCRRALRHFTSGQLLLWPALASRVQVDTASHVRVAYLHDRCVDERAEPESTSLQSCTDLSVDLSKIQRCLNAPPLEATTPNHNIIVTHSASRQDIIQQNYFSLMLPVRAAGKEGTAPANLLPPWRRQASNKADVMR